MTAGAITAPTPSIPVVSELEKQEVQKPKPCCACPDTKKARDVCIIENGEDRCGALIEAHRACMRNFGYVV